MEKLSGATVANDAFSNALIKVKCPAAPKRPRPASANQCTGAGGVQTLGSHGLVATTTALWANACFHPPISRIRFYPMLIARTRLISVRDREDSARQALKAS